MTTTRPVPLPSTGIAASVCAVWRIDLDQPPTEAMRARLSPAERARAERFVFERDRNRHVVAHAALRELLARRTGRHGVLLDMVETTHGKPVLAAPATPRAPAPHFNLSHSLGTGLVAVSDTHEVGVDVEVLRPMADWAALARSYFAPGERAALARLAARDPLRAEHAFFVCWTRKEACLKALGLGLQLATDGFEVGVEGLEGEALDLDIETPEGTQRLRLRSFSCTADAVGALALRISRDAPRPVSACVGTHAMKILS